MKAQSLHFILSHYNMNFSLVEISLGSLVNHFSSSLQAEKRIVKCDCEFSCVDLSFHSDFIQTICCVLRDLHAASLVGCFTQHLDCFDSLWDDEKPGHGLVPLIVFYIDSTSFTSVFP